MDDRPRVGISACLLGDRVRYDGGHKRDAFLTGTLAARVRFVRVCPEVEAGFGAPREPMELRATAAGRALIVVDSGRDVTDTMRHWAAARVGALAAERLDGFVLKSRSPSCGIDDVPVYGEVLDPNGRGLFAAALIARFPSLPIEDEARLVNPIARDGFVERVFAHHRARLGGRR